ncbi:MULTISPECIES: 30S ribosomal protein S17 [Micrococcus]|uniref:Small ribosomal subunit protein uS17 n=1 Tax=Micrococcus luteus TaxID=1270 RepID=A0A653IYD6_MICLU|nr:MULTISPECIES: 30S ribosomal protein S17 [Micrococcus]PFH05713.1 small subunit ribosomal protein S17 [Micrococcaceae bacterium JKS001869]EFD50018.1 30S ribosomal protein S17 [Micrococcus luteus SK58]EZP38179.1 30S ribosomal protein S17 [Micrococcus luteus]KWW40896.1 30S ribosomal protein S17 [Micrococcus luteus]KYK03162.1 30S ribosomal protein S17 [Micrococcus sp. CH3]
MTEQTPAVSEERGYRKALRGIVVSDKMDKTIVVEVQDRKKHSLYGKVMKTSKRVKAHDEDNTAGVGDRVRIAETRPLSASKRWRLVEVVERAK